MSADVGESRTSDSAGANGALMSLLCRIFASEIDEALLAVLASAEVCEIMERAAPGFSAYATPEWDTRRFEDEAAEFCRLFVLPGGTSPRAAAWIDDGEPERAGAIDALYRRVRSALDLTMPDEIAAHPNDHVAPLLLLASWLADHDESASQEFVAQTISPWGERFCAAVCEQSQSPLYRAAGRLLGDMLAEAG